jgi:hypothetical protein
MNSLTKPSERGGVRVPSEGGRLKVIIVGGVAGGASCAARLRRLDEKAEIVMVERGPYRLDSFGITPETWYGSPQFA